MQVPRRAPRILLISKESIVGSGSRPGRSTEGRQNGRGCASGISLSRRTLSRVEISVCPGSGNPYKRPDFPPVPCYFRPVLAGRLTSFRMTEPRILVLIPARMAATRLPGKPLLDIGGLPMIVHVLRRALEGPVGRVAVATDTPEIADAVRAHGGEAVMTRADHPSGSDRIYEAMTILDPEGRCEIVVNLQGDFPTITPETIRSVLPPLDEAAVDIS